MVIILKKTATNEELVDLTEQLRTKGVKSIFLEGDYYNTMTLVGDTWQIDAELIHELPFVARVKRLSPAYHLASRWEHKEDTVFRIGDTEIGKDFCVIAGPCSVESYDQMMEAAAGVKGFAQILRGGVYKPRTSPYTFSGLGKKGIEILRKVRKDAGLPVITEITDISQLDLLENVDMLQIGARNTQNYDLLHAVGELRIPVLLKRGIGATLDEFLQAAEHILVGGNEKVVLCERGIRTFSQDSRFTLDISAVPILKKETHLPVFVDPSHAAGDSELVPSLALAATAAGCDGLLLEVHPHPERALSDGSQQLNIQEFQELYAKIQQIRGIL